MHIDDIAAEYPDVPIILGHCGVQGYFYFGTYADMALHVAARNQNVYPFSTDRYSHLTAVHKKLNQERLAEHYAG
jgi:predicted TIM-barrel fold metal-dependent hydrolase